MEQFGAGWAEFRDWFYAAANSFDAILDGSLESAMNAVPGAEALSEEQPARIRAEVAEELARKAAE